MCTKYFVASIHIFKVALNFINITNANFKIHFVQVA